MRKSLVTFGGFLVFASALAAAPCAPSATSLCLSGGRFEVSVAWKDFQNHTGVGRAVPLTADTGYFWFFTENNIELIVKVLDARGINHKFWVFFGALSNVEYDLTVRDSVSNLTRHYHNPSGQFASVGDTQAFDESAGVVLVSHETMEVQGTASPADSIAAVQRFIDPAAPATSAFTPCPDTRFGFDLAGCRFHIEVEWDDGRGHTGVGQPVQLTNDTGYFWFFNEANVELMVKTLDARPINGNFWFFFGALSNVKYTVTVVDKLTGAFRKYANPSGTFASVGDTGAFSGGRAVVPTLDAANAVSADLDVKGGTVSAVGADGTVYRLELPQNALDAPQTVTLTPVSSLGQLPFSGGLVAGVEIEPDGLDLLVPATLTIVSPSLPTPERTLPFSYAGGGEDFILYPRNSDTSSLRLPLSRFGGYGVAQGGLSDAEAQAARAATAPLGPYLQQFGLDVFRRVSGLITGPELETRGSQIFQRAYQEQIAPFLSPARGVGASGSRLKLRTCYMGDLQEILDVFFRWIRTRQMYGLPDIEGSTESGISVALQRLRACVQESFDLCVRNHDPGEILMNIAIARKLEIMGLQDEDLTGFTQGSLVERCLRFKLEFESELKLEAVRPEYSIAERVKYHTTVPLQFLYSGNEYSSTERQRISTWEGFCTLTPEGADFTVHSLENVCSAGSITPGFGLFDVLMAQIDLSILKNEKLVVLYDPGDPPLDATMNCEGGSVPLPIDRFGSTYAIIHQNESSTNGFKAEGWRPLRYIGNGAGDWAEKEYVRPIPNYAGPGTTVFENTRFILRHTPDADMSCQ